ncbi:MAG TPA: ATP-binding protein [Peptococcaceae bacterium]|jgi:flagellar biosynthesis protein FlhG|nr:ATP-binding protein [Peptococcaceae bacterium]
MMNDQAEKLRRLTRNLHKKIEHRALESNGNKCRIIAVTSGKGGVGKTNIALAISLILSKAKYRVLLLDADLGLANIDVLLGLIPRYNLTHVLKGECTLKDVIVRGPEGLQIIPGGSGIEELANIEHYILQKILQQIAVLDKKVDYLVIDTAAGITNQVLAITLAAHDILLITTPEPTALTDAYGLIKVLRKHSAAGHINLVINMVKDVQDGQAAAQKLISVSKQFLNINLGLAGYVPFDKAVQEAIRQNQSYVLAYPRSPASLHTWRIASLLGGVEQISTGIQDFIKNVVLFIKGEQPEGGEW